MIIIIMIMLKEMNAHLLRCIKNKTQSEPYVLFSMSGPVNNVSLGEPLKRFGKMRFHEEIQPANQTRTPWPYPCLYCQ